MAIWSRISSLIAGGAVATAASEGVRPVLEPVRQHAWQRNQVKVLDPALAARLRAQGHITTAEAVEEASRNGIDANRLAAIVAAIQAAPAMGEATRMARRHTIEKADFQDAMAQHEIPPRWWDGLWDLTNDKLDPVQLANAIHRGLVDDPGLLAVGPPAGVGNVPAYPVYPIDALIEAEAAGFDRDRLGVLVGLMGLPMGPHEAAQAKFRGILTEDDYQRAIAEGNTRNEWAHAIQEQTRQIPTARDFLENALRGYRSLAEAIRGAALHGMSAEHATLIYQNQGRPMNVRRITQALARGAKFNPEPGEITDPYMASIVEGSLKPGYYELELAMKYTPPSVFAIRSLGQSGVWDENTVRTRLLWLGWYPDDAAKVAKAWTSGAGSAGHELTKAELLDEFAGGYITPDELRAALAELGYSGQALERELHLADARRLKSWREKVVAAIAGGYLAHRIDAAGAAAELATVSVTGEAASRLIGLWDLQRRFTVTELSPTQIVKAVNAHLMERDAAIAELEERGYTAEDAARLLDS